MKGNPHPQQTYGQYKVRILRSTESHGKFYGLALPREIAEINLKVKFTPVLIENGDIIFKSGLDIQQLKREVDNLSIDDL